MEQAKVTLPTLPTALIHMASTLDSKTEGPMSTKTKIEYREILPATSKKQAQAESEVRIVGMKDYKKAARCLADAFAADEVARYLVDTDDMEGYGEEYKMRLHTEILEYVTAAHVLKGVVTTIGDFDAVALWMPPGAESNDWLTIFRSGMWRLFYKLSPEGRTRLYREFLPLLHDTAHEVLAPYNDEAWYLVYLGTKPGSRGKGWAGKLIRHGVALANSTSHPTYLESSALVNVPYYQKFGFEVVRDIYLMRGKRPVGLTIMVRRPGAGEGKEVVEGGDGLGLGLGKEGRVKG